MHRQTSMRTWILRHSVSCCAMEHCYMFVHLCLWCVCVSVYKYKYKYKYIYTNIYILLLFCFCRSVMLSLSFAIFVLVLSCCCRPQKHAIHTVCIVRCHMARLNMLCCLGLQPQCHAVYCLILLCFLMRRHAVHGCLPNAILRWGIRKGLSWSSPWHHGKFGQLQTAKILCDSGPSITHLPPLEELTPSRSLPRQTYPKP